MQRFSKEYMRSVLTFNDVHYTAEQFAKDTDLIAKQLNGTKYPTYADFEDAVGVVIEAECPKLKEWLYMGIGICSRECQVRNMVRSKTDIEIHA